MPKPKDMEINRAILEKASRETLIQIIEFLMARVAQLEARIEELEARINQNSSNSNKPTSSDPPYRKQKKQHQKEGQETETQRTSRKGRREQFLKPTEVREVHPTRCDCGCTEFERPEPYYTHQQIELSEIAMQVLHFVLFKGRCRH